MEGDAFPIDLYVESLVLLLRSVKHEDNNHTRSEHQTSLQRIYAESAQHFLREIQQGELDVSLGYFEPVLASIVAYVASSYPYIPADITTDIAIFFTYTAVLDDDTSEESQPSMETFFEDLIYAKEQKHPWWRLMNRQLLKTVKHYGSFCAFNIVRSAFDCAVVFQACWIERHNFHGFPGSHDFPLFLRGLGGIGHGVAGTLFPARHFDEQVLFPEIVSAIPTINNLVIFINDLMSFYKEFDEPRDQVGLVRNYCVVEGITLHQALEKLAHDAIRVCKELFSVFEGRDPQVKATVNAWLQGYITWHLCDHRYRLKEILERAGGSPHGVEFMKYYEQARLVGGFNLEEWASPSISELVEQAREA